MLITFQYSPRILQQAHELHYKKFFQFQSRLPMILGFLSIWAGLLLFLILGKDGNKFLSISLVAFGLIAIAIYYWMMKTIGKRVYKKLTGYRDPFVIDINPQNINMTVRETSYEIPWEDVKKALIAPELILLYPTDRMFYIFPKNNFEGNEFEGFEQLVRRKVTEIY